MDLRKESNDWKNYRNKGVFAISTRPAWYSEVLKRISEYRKLESRAKYLRGEIAWQEPKTTAVYSLAPAHAGTSDQVGNMAAIVSDKQKELDEKEAEIFLIDSAISFLSNEKQLIIFERYINGNKDKYVQRILRKEHGVKSNEKYYSLKDKAVEELAWTFGYVDKDEGVPK